MTNQIGAGAAARGRVSAGLCGAVAMGLVGSSAAVSAQLAHAPAASAQALRYAIGAGVVAVCARAAGKRLRRPTGREWLWLTAVATVGLVLFNLALMYASVHSSPTTAAVAVASVPLVLTAPRLAGLSSADRVRRGAGAGLVTVGAVGVVGAAPIHALGVVAAVVVLACESGFTLLASPVLSRLGAWTVSFHVAWISAVQFALIGAVREGPAAITRFDATVWIVVIYLAVAVTAAAFVCWYTCVERIGSAAAGPLAALAPAAAALCDLAARHASPAPSLCIGLGVLTVGLVVGLQVSPQPTALIRTEQPSQQPTLSGASR